MLAFGVDSFGALGKEAMKVMEKLRSNAAGSLFKSLPTISSPSFAVSALAVCLQKGNAQILMKGALGSRLAAAKWGDLQISTETSSNFA